MSKHIDYSAKNIADGRGWECPTCSRFIRAGLDYCPGCGEMPGVSADNPDSGKYLGGFIGTAVVLIAFFVSSLYIFVFNIIILIPCVAVLLGSALGIETRILARVDGERTSVLGFIVYVAMFVLSTIAYYRIAAEFYAYDRYSAPYIIYIPLVFSAVGLLKRIFKLLRGRYDSALGLIPYGTVLLLCILALFII